MSYASAEPSAFRQRADQTSIEPGCELLDAKRRGARRSKLDRERDAVEPTADRGDSLRNALIQREARLHRARPLNE
jgi:hypothetical protein